MRIIPRLDIKTENVVKGVCFEGLRVIGEPNVLVEKYYQQGADEIVYIDTVASLYGRKNIKHILSHAVSKLHIPLTVGGGITSISDIEDLLNSGADKVAINTFALSSPSLIGEAVKEFGSQSVVVSINAKMIDKSHWVPWTDNAREPTDIDVFEWIRTILDLGAGEVLLTSIDCDGRLSGLDYNLVEKASEIIDVPLVVGGGFATESDAKFLMDLNVDGLSTASFLHYNKGTVSDIKSWVGVECRSILGSTPSVIQKELKSPNFSQKKIGILDYGCGNIFGLCQSFEFIGASLEVVSTPAELLNVDSLVLPGVGAFGHAMRVLNKKGLVQPLIDFAKSEKPILGICLGAQLLLETSDEFGFFDGLGLIPGNVQLISGKGKSCKVPNVGWRKLVSAEKKFQSMDFDGGSFYFTHSFKMLVDEKNSIYKIKYGDQSVQALVTNGRRIFGAQFHPEKSSLDGLEFLGWFCSL